MHDFKRRSVNSPIKRRVVSIFSQEKDTFPMPWIFTNQAS